MLELTFFGLLLFAKDYTPASYTIRRATYGVTLIAILVLLIVFIITRARDFWNLYIFYTFFFLFVLTATYYFDFRHISDFSSIFLAAAYDLFRWYIVVTLPLFVAMTLFNIFKGRRNG
ncbi:hypothetical protein CVM52_04455 [Pseudooceanicola lipolyticus]|uniref:Uncharacterized protein n=1 Tax=Pseudooceanicola lipolyticus TaxID=2029104 RepID=A0A2M8J542_9RHOB|nr:hypothetical protein CVM52_04455 [Pseudooceanicola lipolyticus]